VALTASAPGAKVEVPELYGTSLDGAIQALCQRGLDPKPLVMDAPTSDPALVNKIVAQDPAAGAVVDRDTLVGLALGHMKTSEGKQR
jgi:beta-lactam-binding protein with PASTA domain